MPLVGFLDVRDRTTVPSCCAGSAWVSRKRDSVEGENVTVIYRFAGNKIEQLPELAADLVRRRVAVILTSGGIRPTFAAKQATATIPIVLSTAEDPVRIGLVANLARPGGNLTGVIFLLAEVVAKRLELLREVLPMAAGWRVGQPGWPDD